MSNEGGVRNGGGVRVGLRLHSHDFLMLACQIHCSDWKHVSDRRHVQNNIL